MSTAVQPGQGSAARAVFNAMHRGQPDVVASCATTDDVVAAIKKAREEGLRVAVRGGGHSIAGLSAIDGGMLIDLSPMNGVEVDAERRIARVGGGAIWSEVDNATQPHGLAVPGGVVSDTGVAGLTLGGGYGWVRRKYGLSSDSLLAAEVVTADGEVLTASADENPDLYWALRGGGGNFGVVTTFTFQLREVGPEVAFAATFYPLEDAAEVMRGWRSYVESRAERGHLDVRDDHVPGQPRAARGDPRPAGDHRRRRLRGRRRGGARGDAAAARAGQRRCSTCPGRRRTSASRRASTRCSRVTRCARTGSPSTWTS